MEILHCSLLPQPRRAGPEPYRSERSCSTVATCGVQWDQSEYKGRVLPLGHKARTLTASRSHAPCSEQRLLYTRKEGKGVLRSTHSQGNLIPFAGSSPILAKWQTEKWCHQMKDKGEATQRYSLGSSLLISKPKAGS